MQRITLTTALLLLTTAAMSEHLEEETQHGPCDTDHVQTQSPDPAENPDGFGQLVGERGETNSNTETDDTVADGGDAYGGDPAYGDCDGR
jgi:hypothetical protein